LLANLATQPQLLLLLLLPLLLLGLACEAGPSTNHCCSSCIV
jgi:hypothetical protein